MDLILGSFADSHIAGWGDPELNLFEALLEMSDPDLYNCYAGRETLPAECQNPVTEAFLRHRYAA